MKPGLRCTVCTHPDRVAIDKALIAGGTFRAIAEQHRLSATSVHRHRSQHLGKAMQRAERAQGVADAVAGEATIDTVAALVRRAQELISVAEVRAADGKLTRATDVKSAVAALGGAVKALQLQAQLRGEISPASSTVNVLVDQRGKPREEWAELTGAIFAALRPYPEAARAVAGALSGAASAPTAALVPHVSEQARNVAGRADVVEGEIV